MEKITTEMKELLIEIRDYLKGMILTSNEPMGYILPDLESFVKRIDEAVKDEPIPTYPNTALEAFMLRLPMIRECIKSGHYKGVITWPILFDAAIIKATYDSGTRKFTTLEYMGEVTDISHIDPFEQTKTEE